MPPALLLRHLHLPTNLMAMCQVAGNFVEDSVAKTRGEIFKHLHNKYIQVEKNMDD